MNTDEVIAGLHSCPSTHSARDLDQIGTGVGLSAGVVIPVEQRIFYRLWIDPVPAPDSEPANADFYLEYGDFSY